MHCVVVHEQFIGMFGGLRRDSSLTPDRSQSRWTREQLVPPRLMRTNTRPTFKFASSVEIKRTFVEYPAAFAWSSSLRVHTNVFDRKRTTLLKKWLLLVSQRGNKCGEWLFQIGFIESCLTGAHRSRDDKQCWLLLAQDAISSPCNFTRTLPARGSKLVSNFSTGASLPVRRYFHCRFQVRSYS